MTRRTLLSLPAALPLAAQDALARGKQIVDETLAALGGDRFRAVQDRVETGRAYTFYNSQVSGLSVAKFLTRYLVRPEPPPVAFFGVRERQILSKDGSYYYLFTENGSWEVTYRGAKPVDADTLLRYRESLLHNVLYILRMRLGEPGLVLESKGKDIFDNQPVENVDIVDADNRQTAVSFHMSTKLPVRQLWVRRDPRTRQRFEEVTLFNKFRDAGDGVQWPFHIRRERNGEKIFEMFADSVAIDQGLGDENFTLPASVKILGAQAK